MNKIENTIHSMFLDYETEEKRESNQSFYIKISSSEIINLSIESLSSIFSQYVVRDSLEISLQWGNGDLIIINKNNYTNRDIINQIEYNRNIFSDEKLICKLNIEKTKVNDTISIYSLEDYTAYFQNLTLIQKLDSIRSAFQGNDLLIFEVFEDIISFYTQSIYFISHNEINHPKLIDKQKRQERITNVKNSCHFGLSGAYNFLPEDFKLISNDGNTVQISQLFDRLNIIYSIICLFDYTNIHDDSISLKLNGYKSINGELEFTNIDLEKHKQYYEIYEWVYQGGSVSDKIGLARNIISIHLEPEPPIALKGNAIGAMKSGYEIYLKENIKQYLEVRNNISDKLLDFSKKANEIAEGYANDFHKTFVAFISFFATVIVIRLINKPIEGRLFNDDIAILTYVFLAFSCLYLILSLIDLKTKVLRFKSNYFNLQDRFKDLLIPEDIDKIVNHNKEYYDDLKYIKNKKWWTTALWIVSFVTLALTTAYLASWIC